MWSPSFQFLTCSYAMNLMAVSGAIFKTLIPFPRHKDVRPPSLIICLKPPIRLMWLVLEEWTYSRNMKSFTHTYFLTHPPNRKENLLSFSPAWILSFCPEVQCQCEIQPPPLHQQPAASTSHPSSSPPLWIHPGWPDCHQCPEPGINMNGFSQITLTDAELEDMSVALAITMNTCFTGVLVYEHKEYCKIFSITFTWPFESAFFSGGFMLQALFGFTLTVMQQHFDFCHITSCPLVEGHFYWNKRLTRKNTSIEQAPFSCVC